MGRADYLSSVRGTGGSRPRLLFASYHCYADPSSGAAICTRDLLGLLSSRRWNTRVLSGPALDFEGGESLPQVLSDQRIRFQRRRCDIEAQPFCVYHFEKGRVAGAIYAPLPRTGAVPTPSEGGPFLALLERLMQRHEPDLLLTYDGHWLAGETIRRARRRGIPVVFWLRNCSTATRGVLRESMLSWLPRTLPPGTIAEH